MTGKVGGDAWVTRRASEAILCLQQHARAVGQGQAEHIVPLLVVGSGRCQRVPQEANAPDTLAQVIVAAAALPGGVKHELGPHDPAWRVRPGGCACGQCICERVHESACVYECMCVCVYVCV